MGSLCADRLGAFSAQIFNVIRSNVLPQGKTIFPYFLLTFKTLPASFVYKNDLRLETESIYICIYRIKEKLFCVFEKLRLEKVAKLAEERFCHFESISDCRNNLPSIIIIFFKYLNVENSKIKNKKQKNT